MKPNVLFILIFFSLGLSANNFIKDFQSCEKLKKDNRLECYDNLAKSIKIYQVSSSVTIKKDRKLDKLRQGMPYSKARDIILDASWQGSHKRWQDIAESGTVHQLYYVNNWTEVDECTGAGEPICRFEFSDMHDRKLIVTTKGECLEENKFCELYLERWFIE